MLASTSLSKPAEMTADEPVQDPDVLSLRLWKSGNMRGYKELVQRYERPLFHFIYRIIRDADDTKDILQETFIRFYQSVARLREDKKISAWLYQTAHNLCIDFLRKHKPGRVTVMDHQDSGFEAVIESSGSSRSQQPDAFMQDQDLKQRIIDAIDQLPKKQRMIMTLRGCRELSLKEIADVMDCNEKTVGTTLFAARKRLLSILRPVLEEIYGSAAVQDL